MTDKGYDWMKTPTAIVLWTDKKTYMFSTDHPYYGDVVTRLEKGHDWEDVSILVDPDTYDLESEEDDF
jgi:hypothetical protein